MALKISRGPIPTDDQNYSMQSIPENSASGKRLLERGIDLEFAVAHGAERIAGEPGKMRRCLGWAPVFGSVEYSSSGDKGIGSNAANRARSAYESRPRHCFDAEE